MTFSLDHLPKKARALAGSQLAETEDVLTVFAGRSKQAMIVTDRQLLIVKPGFMAGAALNAKAPSFPLERIAKINVHTGLASQLSSLSSSAVRRWPSLTCGPPTTPRTGCRATLPWLDRR